MSADTQPTSPPPAKFTRYRSMRKAQVTAPVSPPTAPPPEPETQNASIARSMSRYRKSRAATHSQPPAVPAMPTLPRRATSPAAQGTFAVQPPREVSDAPDGLDRARYPARLEPPLHPRDTSMVSSTNPQRERREWERQQKLHEEEEQQRLRRAQKEAEEIVAEQKRKDLERLEAELAAAMPAHARAPSKDKFGLFARKRSPTKSTPSPVHSPPAKIKHDGPPKAEPRFDGPPKPEARHENPPAIQYDGPPKAEVRELREPIIAQAGPGLDAPVSAVNAGERRVLIRCKQSSITLPITPDTTPTNLIYTAANIMTQDIDPKSAILMETYGKLGLERAIRRYEHVRDVMNSWDRDTQNALMIQRSDGPNAELDAASISKKQPDDITVYMYHSQKPGKWNKRFITLCASGQIFIAKKQHTKQTDKDATQICHLSDFDIYTPNAQELRRNLRPPKRFCYAVKSQQKPSIFLSTDNFVHFFSTDHVEVASAWYDAVHTWRSWYLITQMGEGTKKTTVQRSPSRPTTRHKPKISINEDPYTIGSFTPLLDMDKINHNLDAIAADEQESMEESMDVLPMQAPSPPPAKHSSPPAKRQPRERKPPPVSYPVEMELPASGYHPLDATLSSDFAPDGLLGTTYVERQQAQRERELAEKQAAAAQFGPSTDVLVRPQTSVDSTGNARAMPGPHRSQSTRTTHARRQSADVPPLPTAHGLGRSLSKRAQPKPLVDLTPAVLEARQWSQANKGHGVTGAPGAPLVDAATTVTPYMETDHLAGAAAPSHHPPPAVQRSGSIQRRGTVRTSGERERHARAAEWEKMRSADRGGPFVKGSLLERATVHARSSVVADRSRTRDVDVRVGEGM